VSGADLLAASEQAELIDCERIIEDGYAAFLKVGLALAKVRDSRLYRAEHATFEAYCESRWGFTRTRAYELMSAANISQAVSEISDIPVSTESHAKELRGLEPHTAAEVMERAAESGGVTAASIREAREEIAPKPAHVTTTTRTTESTKVEHDVDLDTGEITSPGSRAPLQDSAPGVEQLSAEPGALDPIAAAKAEAAKSPHVLAHKAIDRYRDANQTVNAAGGIDVILTETRDYTAAQNWAKDLEDAIDIAETWLSAIRRQHLRSV